MAEAISGAAPAGGLALPGGGGSNAAPQAPSKSQGDGANGKAQGDTPATQAPKQAETPVPQPQKWKLKAHDKELEVDDIEKLHRLANKGFGADALIERATEAERRAMAYEESFKDKSQLAKAMEEAGYNRAEIAAEWLREEVERRQLQETNPDKLKTMELEQKIARMEAEAEQRTQSVENEKQVTWQREQAKHLNDTFMKALETGGMPADGDTIREMAKAAWNEVRLTGVPITPEAAVASYFDNAREHAQAWHPKMSDEKLAWVLGDQTIERVAKIYASRIRTQQTAPATPQAQPSQTNRDTGDRTRYTMAELRERWGKEP